MNKKQKRNFLVTACLATACIAGGGALFANGSAVATAAGTTPSVSMLAGASARMAENNPGLKFTATIDGYSAEYQYGMLILPEDAWKAYDFNDDYHALLDADERVYSDSICTPYQVNDEWRIALSLVGIKEQNYTRNFVGVAYTLSGGMYDYAEINLDDNARSVTFVSQMALEYYSELTEKQKDNLEVYANPDDTVIDKADFINGVGDSYLTAKEDEKVASNSAAAITLNKINHESGQVASFITKKAYAGGTSFTFDAFVPDGASWWSVCWTTDPSSVSIYAHGSGLGKTMNSAKGAWSKYSVTLPSDGNNYYIYIAGAKGEWGTAEEPLELLIDNITIGSETDDFNASLSGGLFDTAAGVALKSIGEERYEIGSVPTANVETQTALGIIGNKIGGNEKISAVTKEAYAGITEITFDANWTGVGTADRWGISITETSGSYSYYTPKVTGELKQNTGWYSYKIVFDGTNAVTYVKANATDEGYTQLSSKALDNSKSYYVYVQICPGAGINKADVILALDNFVIKTANDTYADNFQNGAKAGLFTEGNATGALTDTDGILHQEEQNALGIIGNKIGGDEKVSAVTKEAYAGITEITFDANWTGVGSTDRWGISVTETAGSYSYYAPKVTGELKQTAGWYSYKIVFDGTNAITYVKEMGSEEAYEQFSSKELDNSKSYYVYVQICPGGGINKAAVILAIDNFVIKTASNTYVDDFQNGAQTGLFNEGNATGALIETPGYVAPTPIYTLSELIEANEIDAYLNDGGYSYFGTSKTIDTAELPANSVALLGSFDFAITGEKEFAILLGSGDTASYLVFDGSSVALYNSVTKSKSVAIENGKVEIAVSTSGKVYVQIDGVSVCLGTAATVNTFKVVGLGGTGSVSFTDFALKTYVATTIPAYVSADGIDMTAYASVPVSLMNDDSFFA